MRIGLSLRGHPPGGGGAPPPPPPPPGLFAAGQEGFQLDPSDLASMRIARDGTGPSPQIGDVVGRIGDLSGNGHDAVATSDAGRPRLEMFGGKPGLRFDEVDDAFLIDGLEFGPDWAFFVSAERTGQGTLFGQMGRGFPRLGQLMRFKPSFVCRPLLASGSMGFASRSVGDSIVGELRAAGRDLRLTLDQTPQLNVTFSSEVTTASSGLVVGDEATNAPRPFGGVLFGLVGYTNNLPSEAQRSAAEAWVRAKKGVVQ